VTPLEWLAEPWPCDFPFDEDDRGLVKGETRTIPPNADGRPLTRGQVFAALTAINGGSTIVKRDQQPHDCFGFKPYGRLGLDEEEAEALIQLGCCLHGMYLALGVRDGKVAALFDAEWRRVADICGVPYRKEPDAST
jgi:hypothetical protein